MTSLELAIDRWRRQRSRGVSAGSQCQEMVYLRRVLLDAGEWRVVYGLDG